MEYIGYFYDLYLPFSIQLLYIFDFMFIPNDISSFLQF